MRQSNSSGSACLVMRFVVAVSLQSRPKDTPCHSQSMFQDGIDATSLFDCSLPTCVHLSRACLETCAYVVVGVGASYLSDFGLLLLMKQKVRIGRALPSQVFVMIY